MSTSNYRGRFAPSPSGLLHAGSLATALGSWLDARAARGTWLVRMEDLDTPRNEPGADQKILDQLAKFGLISDEPVVWQSKRTSLYQNALETLIKEDLSYACRCSRKDIENQLLAMGILRERNQELVYPGICRDLSQNVPDPHKETCAWRAKLPSNCFIDDQNLNEQVGDFVLKRADGIFSYQLAVVVDDHEQGITHIVRGADLLDNTPRQHWLQNVLGYNHPKYLHLPVVLNDQHEKLSKQTKALPVLPNSLAETLNYLYVAAHHLGLRIPSSITHLNDWLNYAITAWPNRHTA